MKTTLLCTTLAAALFASSPAFAADAAKPALKKAPSVRMEALSAAYKEWASTLKSSGGNPAPKLDKLVAQPHSPAVTAMLLKAFGVPSLASFQAGSGAPGMLVYKMTAPAQQFSEVDGEAIAWATLDSTVELDKDGRNMVWNGAWPSLSYKDSGATLTMTDLTFASTQRRTLSDIWVGQGGARVAQVSITPGSKDAGLPDLSMVWDGVDFNTMVTENGKWFDIGYSFQIKALKMLGEQIDDFRLVTRIGKADVKAFEAFSLKVAMNPSAADPKDPFGGNKQEYIAFAKRMAANGTAMEIDELSASFHGHKVMISGKISLTPVTDADFKTAAALSKKIIAHLEVKAPVALVTEIAAIMTRQQAKAKEQVISEEAVAQTAQMITDGMVGKMVSTGFAKLDNGMLASSVDFKGGKLTVNGKLIDLPKAKPAPKKQK